MELRELYQMYKAKKLQAEQAAKEEEKYKKLLKEEMLRAGEKSYTDDEGYLFERIVQQRKGRTVRSVNRDTDHSSGCSSRCLTLMRRTRRNSSSSGRGVLQTLRRFWG